MFHGSFADQPKALSRAFPSECPVCGSVFIVRHTGASRGTVTVQHHSAAPSRRRRAGHPCGAGCRRTAGPGCGGRPYRRPEDGQNGCNRTGPLHRSRQSRNHDRSDRQRAIHCFDHGHPCSEFHFQRFGLKSEAGFANPFRAPAIFRFRPVHNRRRRFSRWGR